MVDIHYSFTLVAFPFARNHRVQQGHSRCMKLQCSSLLVAFSLLPDHGDVPAYCHLHLLTQVRRGKGDNLEFAKFCKELMETKLTDVIHKADIENVGEPVAAA